MVQIQPNSGKCLKYLISFNQLKEEQFVATTDDAVTEILECPDMFASLYPQKPKRPYSYYVATNFHPLDLTQLVNEIMPETPTVTSTTVTTTKTQVTKRVRKNRQISKLEMTNKRLSTSLGDFQIINNEKKKSQSKSKSSSQHGLDCTSGGGCNVTRCEEPTNLKKNSRSRSANRINKFIRNIFKLDTASKEKCTDEQPEVTKNIDKDQQQLNSDDEEIHAPHNNHFNFTRLFSSFRGSQHSVNTSKKYVRGRHVNRNSSRNNSVTLSETTSLKTLKTNGGFKLLKGESW